MPISCDSDLIRLMIETDREYENRGRRASRQFQDNSFAFVPFRSELQRGRAIGLMFLVVRAPNPGVRAQSEVFSGPGDRSSSRLCKALAESVPRSSLSWGQHHRWCSDAGQMWC